MISTTKFQVFLPGVTNGSNNGVQLIAADLREESTTLGHYVTENRKTILKAEKQYATKEFDCFSSMVKQFVEDLQLSGISRISVGFPGPVINGTGESSRLPWVINEQELSQKTGIEKSFLINDLEASAYGLANLSDDCLIPVYEGNKESTGNVAILSPGNGLGEAGLFYDGKYLRPFATEGGHCEFSPRTNVEVEFYQFLNKIYGIVSWESVLSKNGLFNIYRFLRDEKRHPQSEAFIGRLRNEEKEFYVNLFDAANEDNEQICNIAITTYLEFLAREANSLVLKLKATGGLLIGGEIPMLFRDRINEESFYRKFRVSDKMEKLLNGIPVYLLSNEKMIMNGAATYGAFSEE